MRKFEGGVRMRLIPVHLDALLGVLRERGVEKVLEEGYDPAGNWYCFRQHEALGVRLTTANHVGGVVIGGFIPGGALIGHIAWVPVRLAKALGFIDPEEPEEEEVVAEVETETEVEV